MIKHCALPEIKSWLRHWLRCCLVDSGAYSIIVDWCVCLFVCLSVCVDVCYQTYFKSLLLLQFFLWFSRNLAHMISKPICKKLWNRVSEFWFLHFRWFFLNFKFGLDLWNSLNLIPALTFDHRFFTLGKLPLDGFNKHWCYPGWQACSIRFYCYNCPIDLLSEPTVRCNDSEKMIVTGGASHQWILFIAPTRGHRRQLTCG